MIGRQNDLDGDMNLDLQPVNMVPEMLNRAALELWPCGLVRFRTVIGRTHPNDFSGEPTVIGKPETWRLIVDVVINLRLKFFLSVCKKQNKKNEIT